MGLTQNLSVVRLMFNQSLWDQSLLGISNFSRMTQPFMIYGVGNPTRLLEEEVAKEQTLNYAIHHHKFKYVFT